MDLEVKDIARSISYVAGTLATMLKFLSAPVLWVLGACFWPIKAVFSAVFSLVYGILGIIVTPFLVPWYVTVWFWEVAVAVYDELEASTPFSFTTVTVNRHTNNPASPCLYM
jgi:hypothetical protein